MKDRANISGMGIEVIDGCLLVPVHGNEDGESLSRLSRDILAHARNKRTGKVIINVSAVKVMDSHAFSILHKTARAIAMMGGIAVFVGFQPGVASALVELDLDLDQIHTAVTAEDALLFLQQRTRLTDPPTELIEALPAPGSPDTAQAEAQTDA